MMFLKKTMLMMFLKKTILMMFLKKKLSMMFFQEKKISVGTFGYTTRGSNFLFPFVVSSMLQKGSFPFASSAKSSWKITMLSRIGKGNNRTLIIMGNENNRSSCSSKQCSMKCIYGQIHGNDKEEEKNPSKIINTPTQGLTTILANTIPIDGCIVQSFG
jgi:hypothetical protein